MSATALGLSGQPTLHEGDGLRNGGIDRKRARIQQVSIIGLA
jgi:hypothetical protein